jgi:hypothetical protein
LGRVRINYRLPPISIKETIYRSKYPQKEIHIKEIHIREIHIREIHIREIHIRGIHKEPTPALPKETNKME